MPAFQDRIHVGPVEGLLFQHGPLVGQTNGLVGKAHVHPGCNVLPLPGHRGPVPDVHEGQDPPRPGAKGRQALEMGLRTLHRVHPQLLPAEAFLLDLGEAGLLTGTVFPPGLLRAPAHRQQDDLCGEPGEVVDGVEALQISGGEHFSQPPLHFGDQGREGGGGIFQLPVEIGGRVFRRLCRGGGRGSLAPLRIGQLHPGQQLHGPIGPDRVPFEGPGGARGVVFPAGFEQPEVEKGGVSAPGGEKPVDGPGGHGQNSSGQKCGIRHAHTSCSIVFNLLFYTKTAPP